MKILGLNVGGGGTGGPGFGIIQPDSGTSPTATVASDTLIITSSDLLISGNSATKTLTISGAKSTYNAGNSGASITIDWTNGISQYVTLTANVVAITLSNPINGRRHVLRMIQDGTGSRKAYIVGTNLNYALDQGLYNSANPGYSDEIVLDYDGTNYWCVRQITYDSNAVPDSWSVDQGSANSTKYVTVTDSSDFTFGSACSGCLWINTTTNAAQYFISHFNHAGSNIGWAFGVGLGTANKVAFYATAAAGGNTTISSATSIRTGWDHWGWTYDGANTKIYLNGVQDATGACTRVIAASAENLVIGASTNSPVDAFVKGKYSQVALWTTALSAQAMADAYNFGRPRDLVNHHSASASLVLWHRTGNRADSTTTITDYSGLSHTGTPTAYVAADFVASAPQG